jgi:hypothetical protein
MIKLYNNFVMLFMNIPTVYLVKPDSVTFDSFKDTLTERYSTVLVLTNRDNSHDLDLYLKHHTCPIAIILYYFDSSWLKDPAIRKLCINHAYYNASLFFYTDHSIISVKNITTVYRLYN